MTEPKKRNWYFDYLNSDECHMHSIEELIVSKKTKYQHMEILRTGSYGLCLILNGKMQSSEKDEHIYHEALVHPAMLANLSPKKVLIVGGGEGAALREVLRHNVENVLMIDIDEEVVQGCKRYLPEWNAGSFEDQRVTVTYQDAREYLEETEDKFDVIIIDISEPVKEGPSYLLYTSEFYKTVYNALTENGAVSLQAGTVNPNSLRTIAAIYNSIKTAFPFVMPYQVTIPSFGAPWGLILAVKNHENTYFSEDYFDKRLNSFSKNLKYYNFNIHQGQFLLPKYIVNAITEHKAIIEDNSPHFLPSND